MSTIKSFAVGNGDMYYVKHNSDNFSIIDCNLSEENSQRILKELKAQSKGIGITRFISTHPDEDHFGGIELLDKELPIPNFYVVKNKATKAEVTSYFKRYCELRDCSGRAFHIHKDCRRKWLNIGDDQRGAAGINILWPVTTNPHFIEALLDAEAGGSPNNISAVIRYQLQDGASFMWLGDLDTEFMENIVGDIQLQKTTVVFAPHHGRSSGKIPDSWLKKLDPQIIVIGEAPSRHLHYYTGYEKITQNKAGDITFDVVTNKVHIYASNPQYHHEKFADEGQDKFFGYIGSVTVEREYTLAG